MIVKKSLLFFYKSRFQWFKALMLFIGGIAFIAILSFFCKVVISETDSLPEHYFLHFPFIKAHKNDYTFFYSEWYQGKIIKKIIGVEGDKVMRDKTGCVWVNQTRIGIPKLKATDGSRLTPVEAKIIPKGYVFVYSNNENSFDSRYEELGLIPVSRLQGRLLALR